MLHPPLEGSSRFYDPSSLLFLVLMRTPHWILHCDWARFRQGQLRGEESSFSNCKIGSIRTHARRFSSDSLQFPLSLSSSLPNRSHGRSTIFARFPSSWIPSESFFLFPFQWNHSARFFGDEKVREIERVHYRLSRWHVTATQFP